MNLTTRSRWLTAIAAGIAGWVIFGPKDPDAVEATAATAVPAAHATHAAAAPHPVPAVAGSALLALADRVAEQTAAGALFATHSWYVAPPPPPQPVAQAPVEPAKPVAPPLPYQFIGSYKPEGQPEVFFLSAGEKVYDVHVGDTLENTYTIDSFNNGALVLTYKPLNEKQQLQLAGAGK